MTCEKFQHQILLLQSGELPGKSREPLERHIAACPACAAFAHDLEAIAQAASSTSTEPSSAGLARIRNEAEACCRTVPSKRRSNAPLLAMAASLALLLAGSFILQRLQDTRNVQATALKPANPDAPQLLTTADADLLFGLELADDADAYPSFMQDTCLAIEQSSDLLEQGRVTPAQLDIMFLEAIAI